MSDPIRIRRRGFVAGFAALSISAGVLPRAALAFSEAQAETLIDKVVRDINAIISSGKSEVAMINDFEKIFVRYGDSRRIALLVLGVDGRSASSAQKSAFAKAFQHYISIKYGRRFREFIGGRIEVKSTKKVKNFYEVHSMVYLKGEAPFEVVFIVADANGRFIDMLIEGISLVKSEREEIGHMLDARKRDLNRLIADLNAY